MKLPKTSSILSLILLIGIFVGTVSADYSTTINIFDNTTQTDSNFTLRIVPESVRLKPLQTVTFHAIITTPNGNEYEAPTDYTQWHVLKGGGHINQDGMFRAGEIPGEYENTIEVQVLERYARASIKIVDIIKVLPSPTPGLEIDDITATPTQTPRTSSDDGTTTVHEDSPEKTPTPSPTPTPVTLPSAAEIVPTFVPPTPTPTTQPSHGGNNTPTSIPTVRPQKIATPTPTNLPDNGPTDTTATQKENASNMYVEDNVQLCLRTVYSKEIYNRYFNPTGERKDPSELGSLLSAAQRCFKTNRTIDLDAETITCLKEILSEKRYSEITIDNEDPTLEELQNAKACTTKPREISYSKKNEIDPTLLGCLEVQLGVERLQGIIQSAQQPSAAELTQARECFTLDEGITQPPLVITVPEETVTCLENALGKNRAEGIKLRVNEPTSEERTKASACFAETLDNSQQAFMPPSIEQLPYIEIAQKDEASINSVKAQTHTATEVLTLSGKTHPFAVVDIYIFSNPIIVSTTADANGDWFYELSYHLDDGDHKAYTVVQHPEKGYVKSEVFAFNVARAESDTTAAPELVVEPLNTSSAITRTYLVAAVGITGIGAILLLLIGYWFTKRQPAKLPGMKPQTFDTDSTHPHEE